MTGSSAGSKSTRQGNLTSFSNPLRKLEDHETSGDQRYCIQTVCSSAVDCLLMILFAVFSEVEGLTILRFRTSTGTVDRADDQIDSNSSCEYDDNNISGMGVGYDSQRHHTMPHAE